MAQSLLILLEWLSSGTIWNWKQIFVKLQVSEESIGGKKKCDMTSVHGTSFVWLDKLRLKMG